MAKDASVELQNAADDLQNAAGAKNRIKALTNTIRAFETGLLSMRQGLRAAAVRERVITLEFSSRREQISQLLGVLLTLERATTPLLMIHPQGAVGTARSGMMVSEVTPGLQRKAEALRAQLNELQTIRALQTSAETELRDSLDRLQQARVALSQAVAQRTDLPQRFTDDPATIQTLADNSATLSFFADPLRRCKNCFRCQYREHCFADITRPTRPGYYAPGLLWPPPRFHWSPRQWRQPFDILGRFWITEML